ncbi:SA1362 family protein [Texcoconibacillus texcoconensis]|uniref:Uncharacterized protein n=1 Tax=Texcoconibacillus texcoconensis TaxID=1095777 RepID=A0A840QNZ2_9BACI|nr:SA1362 family protein [Texcoconibacillus texcoconensis]MBB5173089.1 hypothetical protein [Texcoconibacillus texcoconensis]
MFRHSIHPMILIIFALAIIGLGYRLFTEPGRFLLSLLTTVAIAGVIIWVFKRFVIPKMSGGYQTQYQPVTSRPPRSHYGKKASKTNKAAFWKKDKKNQQKRTTRPLVKKQSDVQLKVIEGKKNKKKNRALF